MKRFLVRRQVHALGAVLTLAAVLMAGCGEDDPTAAPNTPTGTTTRTRTMIPTATHIRMGPGFW